MLNARSGSFVVLGLETEVSLAFSCLGMGGTVVAVSTGENVGEEGDAWIGARLQAVKHTRNREFINRCMAHFSLTPMFSCIDYPPK